MVTNTRLVIGTVETLCCVAAEAWARPAKPRTRRPLRTHGGPSTWQWQPLPRLGIQLSVALTTGILRPWSRPQLLLKLLHHLFQVLTGLTLPQQVSSKLFTVSLRMLQLRLQVFDLKGTLGGQQGLTAAPTTQGPVSRLSACPFSPRCHGCPSSSPKLLAGKVQIPRLGRASAVAKQELAPLTLPCSSQVLEREPNSTTNVDNFPVSLG